MQDRYATVNLTQAGLQNTLTHLFYLPTECSSTEQRKEDFVRGLGEGLMQDRYATVNLIKARLKNTDPLVYD